MKAHLLTLCLLATAGCATTVTPMPEHARAPAADPVDVTAAKVKTFRMEMPVTKSGLSNGMACRGE